MNTPLTPEDRQAIESLRERGFAVIVWTPEEIEKFNVSPFDIEAASVIYINNTFDW